jgi:single-strand DNA-binding protein
MANFNLNKVILGGRLTGDPELKQTQSGVSVCTFGIAVNRRFNSKDSAQQTQADFFNITAWRQSAEFVSKYFNKGRAIVVVGSLQTRNWTDQNGQKRYTVEVVADEVSFVERKTDSQPRTAGTYYGEAPAARMQDAGVPDAAFVDASADEDLPF